MTEKSGSLGNTGKSASLRAAEARVDRYMLQSEARRLVSHKDALQGCLRWPTGGGNGRVAVYYRRAASYAFYGGLQTCGQIWKCPVCAAKITERRRQLWTSALGGKVITQTEIEDSIVVKNISHGYSLAMATFTISHTFSDKLIDVINRLSRAYDLLWSGKWAVEFKREYQVVGTVRALEITHGDRGWHPHIHCLFVIKGEGMRYSLLEIRDKLSKRWSRVVNKAGGFASIDNGCDFRVADVKAVEYIDKLGIDTTYHRLDRAQISEVTKFPVKRGRGDNVALFGMLGKSLQGDDLAAGRWQLAQAILKGRKHISTSRGLLRLLGASQELSDDKLASREVVHFDDEVLALLERPQWDVIDRLNARAELLNVAQSGSREAVQDFLIEMGVM